MTIDHRVTETGFAKPFSSAIGNDGPTAHPLNCRNECPYGRDRAFCFPCYAKILAERRALKKKV